MATTMSQKGVAALNYLEGCPLKAYRDVAGVWTIGAGLTAACGVIVPKAGMVITQAQADRLLKEALESKYIPAVLKRMGRNQSQHVIDGAVSFHFNTGAIAKASWVAQFLRGNFAGAREKLRLWRKAGGKVVPGLVKRREIEADMIINGLYPTAPKILIGGAYARIAIPLSAADINKIQSDFESLGYAVKAGNDFHLDAIEKFQRDNNLKVDGVIGKATLAMLQRQIDARAKTKGGVVATVGSGTAGLGGDAFSGLDGWATMVGFSVTLISIAYMCWLAWVYRDVVAQKIERFAPRLAEKLRSI